MPTPGPESPQLAALQRDIGAGDESALAAFWQAMASQGTPLIELIADNDSEVLVTFLWRGVDEVRNVVVVGGLATFGDFAGNQMERLPGTDLWYRTYRARRDLHTYYQLSVNDSLVGLTDWASRTATFQPDPLNPERYVIPADPENPAMTEQTWSIVALPDALPQPYVLRRPAVPAGSLTSHRLHSVILANDRRVWVYTPPRYTTEGPPYPLLLLFDGFIYSQVIPTPTILDNMLADGVVPPLVALMVDSPQRGRELGHSLPFVDFLARELLPWVHERYHVSHDAERTIVGGSSLGGVAAACAALHRPDLFGRVLSQSGAFWRAGDDGEHEWLAREFAARPAVPVRFYLDVGLRETVAAPGDGPSNLIANRHLRTVLRAKSYDVHYAEFNGGHNFIAWQGTLSDGLMAVLRTDADPSRA